MTTNQAFSPILAIFLTLTKQHVSVKTYGNVLKLNCSGGPKNRNMLKNTRYKIGAWLTSLNKHDKNIWKMKKKDSNIIFNPSEGTCTYHSRI